MSEISVVFPAAAALLCMLVVGEYVQPPLPGLTAPERCHHMERRDHVLAWVLTAVYALCAFIGLGTAAEPECFYRAANGAEISAELPASAEIADVRWFAGLGTGSWTLETSLDGQSWQLAAAMEQNYVAILKWNRAEPASPAAARYIRLRAVTGSFLEAGEMAFFDDEGVRILPLTVSEAGLPLFDEQGVIPESSNFRNSSYFDEIYHARTAWEGLRGETLYEITHPPLGKLILSLGILIFGMNPFGWRFMGTLCGALMLPILYALLKRLFGRRGIAACGTLIFAFDFMHFTQTRIATIDTYSVLFILCMYYCMYRFLTGEGEKRQRLWLALAGVSFGLGAASKWTSIYAGAGLAVLWLLYWCFRRDFRWRDFGENVGFCVVFFVIVPMAIYYISYWPYGHAAGLSWPGMLFSREYGKLVLDNQRYMWSYHSRLVATHPYSSEWWQWVLDIRPILYYLESFPDGSKSAIAAFTSPLLCWGGIMAMLVTAAEGVRRRDNRALFILTGYLSQLLPWVPVTRLTFAYHYFPSEVFLVLGLCYVFAGTERKRGERWPYIAFTAVSLLLFAAFYPVLSGAAVPRDYCAKFLRWFSTWPI